MYVFQKKFLPFDPQHHLLHVYQHQNLLKNKSLNINNNYQEYHLLYLLQNYHLKKRIQHSYKNDANNSGPFDLIDIAIPLRVGFKSIIAKKKKA